MLKALLFCIFFYLIVKAGVDILVELFFSGRKK